MQSKVTETSTTRVEKASIYPRTKKDGVVVFEVRYRRVRKHRSRTFDTIAEARLFVRLIQEVGTIAAQEQHDSERGRRASASSDRRTTLSDYVEVFLTSGTNAHPGTIRAYRLQFDNQILPYLGHLLLPGITGALIDRWLNKLETDGLAPRTIRNREALLRSALNFAVESGDLAAAPARSRRRNANRGEAKEMVALSPSQFAKLLNYIPQPYRPLVILLYGSGLRFGEATALTPADIDIERSTIHVRRGWRQNGEGQFVVGPPKTRRSLRAVPLQPSVREAIAPLLDDRPSDALLFTSPHSGDRISQNRFYEGVWDPARRLANGELPKRRLRLVNGKRQSHSTSSIKTAPSTDPIGVVPRVHDLRHSFASTLLSAGTPITIVSRLMGHTSITTTVDTYGHILEREMHAGAAPADAAIQEALTTLKLE